MMDSGEHIRFSNMSLDNSETGSIYQKKQICTRPFILVIIFTIIISLGCGIIIGHFAIEKNDKDHEPPPVAKPVLSDEKINSYLKRFSVTSELQKQFFFYTERTHLSGTEHEKKLVMDMEKLWAKFNLDLVRVTPYDVLLSYPNTSNPNKVQLLNGTGEIEHTSAEFEKPLDEQGNSSDIVLPYNSYAAAGVAEGDLVYVNYGRIEDFLLLVNNFSIPLENKIVIARYGKIFRGDKVKNAERFNCSGVIMYTDPSDFNIYGTNNTYPNSWWLPGTGVQRGTVGDDGDYLTPFYPATDYAFRKKISELKMLRIPAQPIGYDDALVFLREMEGPKAPDDWQGTLPITYNIGPGLKNNQSVRLTVNNYEEIRTVHNLIGYVIGSEEPDRYVLLGNHHDSWVFGAIDPESGSTALHSIARAFGKMKKDGIRPKRTVVFCSWGGEEQGLIGSTEYVEEHMKILRERAVAYINVDYACDYNYVLVAGTSPLLQDALYNAAKQVPNPDTSSSYKTVYDIWNHRTPGKTWNGVTEPSVYYSLGSGSDMATFYQRAGVPSVDMWFTYNENKWDILSYPTYHSAYETRRMYNSFIDPGYKCMAAMANLWGIMAWQIADADILPFDVRRYASAINSFIESWNKQFGEQWKQHNVNIAALESASRNLTDKAKEFQEKVSSLKNPSSLQRRIFNDKMMLFERAFLDPEGLPGRRQYKHVLFAPSLYDSYSDNSFPGIVDTMTDISQYGYDKWDLLKEQVYVATFMIDAAANTLNDIGL